MSTLTSGRAPHGAASSQESTFYLRLRLARLVSFNDALPRTRAFNKYALS